MGKFLYIKWLWLVILCALSFLEEILYKFCLPGLHSLFIVLC